METARALVEHQQWSVAFGTSSVQFAAINMNALGDQEFNGKPLSSLAAIDSHNLKYGVTSNHLSDKIIWQEHAYLNTVGDGSVALQSIPLLQIFSVLARLGSDTPLMYSLVEQNSGDR